jgi:hypothetical protein
MAIDRWNLSKSFMAPADVFF